MILQIVDYFIFLVKRMTNMKLKYQLRPSWVKSHMKSGQMEG